MGLSRACEMTFTGDPVDAATALEWQLVSRVVAADELMGTARALAERIACNPPRSVRLSKRLIREGQTMRFDQLLELAAAYQGACHQTKDHEEAVSAIIGKREPNFTGQ
jgi:enoyl-CoA hydratase/carnithine racemase